MEKCTEVGWVYFDEELPMPALRDLKGPSEANLLADGFEISVKLTKRLGSLLQILDKIASPHFFCHSHSYI